ncbi:MAG: urea transporter [Deltaproteobacteria bacterium]|nr:urea transporter [Deltaproteobacteria bacterium]
MAVDTDPVGRPVREAAIALLDAFLLSYAQLLFSRSRVVGLLLLMATAVAPPMLAAGALAVLLAMAAARIVGLAPEAVRSGLVGYNALLVGFGGFALYGAGPDALALVAVAVVAATLVTAAVHSAFGTHFNLPALTVPFLLVFLLVLGAAPLLGLPSRSLPADPLAPLLDLPAPVASALEGLGAIFFLPRVDVGLIVFLALVVWSRIGALLAVVGFAATALVGSRTVLASGELTRLAIGVNGALTAMALGGVWFVPSPASFVLAFAGALGSCLVSLGLLPLLDRLGLPLLILPFNLTVLLMLHALRQRAADRWPKAVDFAAGTPEENLTYFRTRLARFGARYLIRFQAPFLGTWTCTQGSDDRPTHRGPWRHAFDFEVAEDGGALFHGAGAELTDYHCYRLPVLATAAGTVVRVVDGVPDNPVGSANLDENWGNAVVLWHAPGLHSLVCHLSPGTIKIRPGDVVRPGDVLGLCGSSGRSPRPHLHFQLQASDRLGAPTLPAELRDVVVVRGEDDRLPGTVVPRRDDRVRNLQPAPEVARLLAWEPERTALFAVTSGRTRRIERITAEVGFYGDLKLRAEAPPATLHYDLGETVFTVLDTIGAPRSALHLLHAALPRIPLEISARLSWTDHLPRRRFLPRAARALLDLAAPFTHGGDVEMTYRGAREGRDLVVRGESTRRLPGGTPWLATEARFRHGQGLVRVEVSLRGRRHAVERIEETTAATGGPTGEGGE